jgi:hypothetical protein
MLNVMTFTRAGSGVAARLSALRPASASVANKTVDAASSARRRMALGPTDRAISQPDHDPGSEIKSSEAGGLCGRKASLGKCPREFDGATSSL